MYDVRYDVDIRMYSTDKICKQTSLSISSTCSKRIPTKIGPNAPQNRNRPGAMGVKFKLLPVNLGVRTMLRFSSRTESQNSGQVILWDVSAPTELQTLKNLVFIQKSCNCRSLTTSGFSHVRVFQNVCQHQAASTSRSHRNFCQRAGCPGWAGTDGSKASYMGDLSRQILS